MICDHQIVKNKGFELVARDGMSIVHVSDGTFVEISPRFTSAEGEMHQSQRVQQNRSRI
jgi:hypothetical protein